jgi:hypothetical protein
VDAVVAAVVAAVVGVPAAVAAGRLVASAAVGAVVLSAFGVAELPQAASPKPSNAATNVLRLDRGFMACPCGREWCW